MKWWIIAVPVLFLAIYHQVFFADYAFLDEIHQLWNNDDRSNYNMFFSQGRWLTAIIVQKAFSSITYIEELKYLRIISLTGWILTTVIWSYCFRRWIKLLSWDWKFAPLSDIFFVCSASVAIYIGWASCIEVFVSMILAILSTHLAFIQFWSKANGRPLNKLWVAASAVFGVLSLFCYQACFGLFILPYLLAYISQRKSIALRVVLFGILTYFVIYVLYYVLFQWSLTVQEMSASNRAGLSVSPLKKIGFFFSGPLPAAFSLNVLYRGGSLLNQLWQYLLLVTWLVCFFRTRQGKISGRIGAFIITILLLVLTYLPSMVSVENFASYRSLFVFAFSVFLVFIYVIHDAIKTVQRRRDLFSAAFLLLVATGYYNFNIQFIRSLKVEYKAVREAIDSELRNPTKEVHFVRAEGQLFKKVFGLNSYKDEFGVPSTSRDWVPEPLVKQIVFENSGDRKMAGIVSVIQYVGPDAVISKGENASIVLDVNKLLGKN
jgi:hypothetical protein